MTGEMSEVKSQKSKVRGKNILKISLILHFAFCIFYFESISAASETAPRNPDSAKECAICHYNWIDTFYIEGRGSDLVPYTSEKTVAKPEMCFSCHDGSVVDSRARVYNDLRHKINQPPPASMKIPKIFPLDKDGKMQCFTCHTAHGVPSEMGMERTIFVRTSNKNSAMCVMCHADKDGGTAFGNHPVGPGEKEIPKALVSYGAVIGDGKNQIICETCHTVHGSPNASFLIESAKDSRLCLECHTDKNIFTPDGKRNHYHVINVKPEKVKIPEELFQKGAELGFNAEIICQTCHKVHNNKIEEKLLLIKRDNKSTLCLTCHTDKKYIEVTKHNLQNSAPGEKNLDGKNVAESGICSPCHLPHKEARKAGEGTDFTTRLCLSCHSKGNIAEKAIPVDYRHPVDVNPFESNSPDTLLTVIGVEKDKLTLPLFNKFGIQDKGGNVTCATCHDPHRWRADSAEGEIRKDIKGDNKTSFLRRSAPDLCKECHSNKFYIADSKHDIAKVAPETKNYLDQTPAQSGLCGSCHNVHGGQKSYLWAREITTKSGQVVQDLCISCHNENGMAKKKIVKDYSHPLNITPAEKGLTTTLPLFDKNGKVSKSGLMACQTCHDPHRWDPAKIIPGDHSTVEGTSQNSFLRLANSPSSSLCGNCHPEQSYIERTDHDMIVTAPDSKNITGETPAESGPCGVCHIVHNGKNKLKLWGQSFAKGGNLMDMMCNSCHSDNGVAKNKVPTIASHPEGQLITNVGKDAKGKPNYFPLFEQHTGKNVSVGNISCPSCHNVHQWDPKFHNKGTGANVEGTATNSFLRMQTYSLLCIDCHGLDALFRFKYYHDPNERVEKGSFAQGMPK
ncbi:MAG: cytochrome c3 family protein [Nitrospirae bacterium]|nr:cytochrome c3 family protein [Nitrospirota bacterium]